MESNNSKSIKAPLTGAMKMLAVLFGIGFILGFILTPLGVETRSPEIRTLLFGVFFIVIGLLIPLVGLVLIWLRKNKFAGVLAVVGAAFIFLVAPADQALFFFTVSPPPAVTIGEFILIFVGIGYMLYGPKVYDEEQI
ncbi:hypothetical protein Metbo_1523 [Methanobacterium lacus]|uniref:Uncharacterized protein n=1 Tax=Methanobacterium lacus (strain AL-21) TaxID=877455 RepID=F0T8K2_METLA|nr:hypothetical protein [Methanobacterium lacus]ADZ09753.1 hypothetical protein Metbo_1523 [Methanobacterium lacus]